MVWYAGHKEVFLFSLLLQYCFITVQSVAVVLNSQRPYKSCHVSVCPVLVLSLTSAPRGPERVNIPEADKKK